MMEPKLTKQEVIKRLELALSIGDAPIGERFLANVDKQTINDALNYLKETPVPVASADIPNESEIFRVAGIMAEHISSAEYVDSTYVNCVDISVFKDGIEVIKQLLAYQHFLMTTNDALTNSFVSHIDEVGTKRMKKLLSLYRKKVSSNSSVRSLEDLLDNYVSMSDDSALSLAREIIAHSKYQEAEIERLRGLLKTADGCIGECEHSLTKVPNSRVESAVNDWAKSGYTEYLKELEEN